MSILANRTKTISRVKLIAVKIHFIVFHIQIKKRKKSHVMHFFLFEKHLSRADIHFLGHTIHFSGCTLNFKKMHLMALSV